MGADVTFISDRRAGGGGDSPAGHRINAVRRGGTVHYVRRARRHGLPTLDANANSAVALTPANLARCRRLSLEVRTYYRDMILLAIIGLIGGGGRRPVADRDRRQRISSAGAVGCCCLATLLFAFGGRVILRLRRTLVGADKSRLRGSRGLRADGWWWRSTEDFLVRVRASRMLAALSILESGNFHRPMRPRFWSRSLIQIIPAALLIAGMVWCTGRRRWWTIAALRPRRILRRGDCPPCAGNNPRRGGGHRRGFDCRVLPSGSDNARWSGSRATRRRSMGWDLRSPDTGRRSRTARLRCRRCSADARLAYRS